MTTQFTTVATFGGSVDSTIDTDTAVSDNLWEILTDHATDPVGWMKALTLLTLMEDER